MGHPLPVIDGINLSFTKEEDLEKTMKVTFLWEQKLGYQSIKGKNCKVCLEPRPSYCDRGKFLAKIFISDPSKLQIDHQDGWSRYYFFEGYKDYRHLGTPLY